MKRLLLAPFLLIIISGCTFYDKTFSERRDICADYFGGKLSRKDAAKKLNLPIQSAEPKYTANQERRFFNFCDIYLEK